jgi:hypothetical protein
MEAVTHAQENNSIRIRIAGRFHADLLLLAFFSVGIITSSRYAEAAAVEATSITLTWTAPGDDGNYGTAKEYDIRYSTTMITEDNWDTATQVVGEPTPRPAGTVESCTIAALLPGTLYFFAVRTVDDAMNWSPLSNIATIRTHDKQIFPVAIDDLTAFTGNKPGEMILCWTVPAGIGHYGIIYSGGTINKANRGNADLWPDPPAPLPAGERQTFTLTGLNPGCRYWAAIIVYDDAGNTSELSNIASGVTGSDWETGADGVVNPPVKFKLFQNYPNPFNPGTIIEYHLPESKHVSVSIYNILGQHINVLVDETKSAGVYSIAWNGRDSAGRPAAAGVYICCLRAGRLTDTRKMILQK